jgi:4-hydroxybutyrate CoA-transferase
MDWLDKPSTRRSKWILPGRSAQVDFIRGAARAKGGKPILALPSTAKNGNVSRVVLTLIPGAGVVTVRQRAEALIAIADPKFHEELERSAFKESHLTAGLVAAG